MKTIRYLIFLIAVVLIFGEIGTRLFIPEASETHLLDRTQAHPYLRVDWNPNFKTTYIVDGIGAQQGPMNFEINPFAFRSKTMKTSAKPAATTRLFFLGESTTECLYIPEEKTFPSLVEGKLNETFTEKHFEGINGGISGTLVADSLAALIYKVMYYEPDTVIIMQAINDLRYGTAPDYDPINRPQYHKIFTDPREETLQKFLTRILKRSQFLTLIKHRLINRIWVPADEIWSNNHLKKISEYDEWRRNRLTKPVHDVPESKSLPDFIKSLEEMIFIAKGHHVRLILMTEPFIYKKDLPPAVNEKLWMGLVEEAGVNLSNDFMLREMNRFNDAVRELSRKYDVELIDLEKEMPKDLVHFYDDVHLTPAGSQQAAKVISDYLIQKGFSSSQNAPAGRP